MSTVPECVINLNTFQIFQTDGNTDYKEPETYKEENFKYETFKENTFKTQLTKRLKKMEKEEKEEIIEKVEKMVEKADTKNDNSKIIHTLLTVKLEKGSQPLELTSNARDIFVSNLGKSSCSIINAKTGDFITEKIKDIKSKPYGISVTDKYFFTVCQETNKVFRMDVSDPDKNILSDNLSPYIKKPKGIAYDPKENSIWICSKGNSSLVKYYNDDTNGIDSTITPISYDFSSCGHKFGLPNNIIIKDTYIVVTTNTGKLITLLDDNWVAISVADTPLSGIADITGTNRVVVTIPHKNQIALVDIKSDKNAERNNIVIKVGARPYYCSYFGNWIAVSNSGSNTVSLVHLKSMSVQYTIDVGKNPQGVHLYGSRLSVTNKDDDTVSIIILSFNICFPEKTPVSVDQGVVAIENIDPEIHTIDNKKILSVTKSISNEDYLVCFKKNALGANTPSKKTVMSSEHMLLYDGKMKCAREFIGLFGDNVVQIPYTGETLYNVLMENHEKMRVNNLIVETLHPLNLNSGKFLLENDMDKQKEQICYKI